MTEVTKEEAREPSFGAGPFRAFRVTATVLVPRDSPLPTRAYEWFARVNMMGSSLESVTEIRYPLASDIVEQREKLGTGPLYG